MALTDRIVYKVNENFHDIVYTKNILKSLLEALIWSQEFQTT